MDMYFIKCDVCGFSMYQDQSEVACAKCKTCPANSFIVDDKKIALAHSEKGDCIACSLGKFAAAGDRFCETCLTGKEPRNNTCEDCIAGTFGETNRNCTDCPAGYYQDSKGQASCLPCIP